MAIISCVFCGFPFPACLGAFGCPDCAAGDEPWPEDAAPETAIPAKAGTVGRYFRPLPTKTRG